MTRSNVQLGGQELKLDADADTSITVDTDDQIDFKVGGVDEMTMSSSGIVINEGSNDRDFRIETNGYTHCLFIEGGTDRVLINKSSATANWFNGTSLVPSVEIFGTANTSNRMTALTYGSADAGAAILAMGKSRSATPDNYTIIQDDDQMGIISFQGTDGTHFLEGASIRADIDVTPGANDMPGILEFHTTADGADSGTERMRIEEDGHVAIGHTTTNRMLLVQTPSSFSEYVVQFKAASSSAPYGILTEYSGAAPDSGSDYEFFIAMDTGATRCTIFSDGDIKNHDNSYGALSDERIKQDIRDSNSQWDDIKAVKVRNFKKKDDVRQYGDKAWEQIGVIAQELETVSPKLIRKHNPSSFDILSNAEFGTLYTSDDSETQDAVLYTAEDHKVIEGSKNVGDIKKPSTKKIGDVKEIKDQVKSVNYSVLYMKAIKALQEAMAKIETLETKVKALEDA